MSPRDRVLWPSILAYFSSHIVTETKICEATGRITVFESTLFVLASYMACACGGFYSRWATDARIRSQGARGVFFSMTRRVLRLVDDKDFILLFDDLSFDLTHAVLTLRRTQKVDWSKLCSVGSFQNWFFEDTVRKVNRFRCSAKNNVLMGGSHRRKLFRKLLIRGFWKIVRVIVTPN